MHRVKKTNFAIEGVYCSRVPFNGRSLTDARLFMDARFLSLLSDFSAERGPTVIGQPLLFKKSLT
jgi:hypothetical protein